MEVKAVVKYLRVQPRKVRIIADEVRGENAVKTVHLLRFHTSKSAALLRKVLISAMANAQENHGLSPDQLRIATIMVDEGPRLKRMQARAMGRGNRIVKKTSHITVVVEDYEGEVAVKPHGTKAKPRPTFGAPKKGKKSAAAAPVEAPVAAPVEEEEVVATEAVETPEVETVIAETASAEPVAEAPAAEATDSQEETK
jgi:large subunit ribosomal protein L22